MTSRRAPLYPVAAAAVTIVAAVIYVWSVRNGSAHNYYTPAAVGMSESLSNFLFGSYDTGGFAGVDKIPGSLWPQAASVALFGYSTWSVLLPQALASAATVALTYLAVGRWLGRPAGLTAAVVYATTPLVAALAQTNVPEPWFGLWLAVAAYLTLRAIASPARGLWWLIAAAGAIGAAFQVKMLEAWILVPAVFVPYLVAATARMRTRIWHVLAAGAIALAASLWWVVLVSAVPASQRPWVGGSNGNSAWEMVFGYNGLGRFGIASDRSFVADFAGPPGLARLIGPQLAVDVGWFLPLAVVSLIVGLAVTAHRPRIDIERAGYLVFGLWLVPAVLVMVVADGIHTFYVLLYALPIAALAAAGARQALQWWGTGRRWPLIVGLVAQAAWAAWLVVRADEHPWVATVIAGATLLALVAYLLGRRTIGTIAAAFALLVAPLVWAAGATGPVNTINPTAGAATMGGPGGGPGAGPTGAPPSGPPDTAPPGLGDGSPIAPGASPAGQAGPPMGPGGDAAVDADALAEWLQAHAPGSRYLVAADSRTAGPLILGGLPGVMALGGGFDGSDPTPTATELAALVASGELRYVLQGSGGGIAGPGGGIAGPGGGIAGPGGGNAVASEVTAEREEWITANCAPVADAPTSSGTVLDCASG